MSRQSHRQFRESERRKPFPSDDLTAELALAQRRFEATFLHAPVGICHVDLAGRFLIVNPRFCEISGHDAATLLRTGFQQITHPEDLHIDEDLLARLLAGEFPRYALEKRYIRGDGTTVWINLTVAMVRDQAGQPEFFVAVIEDLSDLRRASFEAVHDPLTGLLNRRGLAAHAQGILAAARVGGASVSLLFLDLDGFKQLNDRRGHAAGDACLVDVAQLLSAYATARDAVARVGGDEFVMLLAGRDGLGAEALAQAVGVALAAQGAGVSGSFGLVHVAADDSADLDRMIASADVAMLAAKHGGKNQLRVGVFAD